MYSNQSFVNKLFFYISPRNFTFLIIFLILFIGIISYNFLNTKQVILEELSDIDKYSNYIYDYAVSIKKLDDIGGEVAINNFTFDNNLYEVSDDPSYKWNNHAEAFLEVILIIQDLALLTTDEKSKYYKSMDVWEIVEFFIQTVMVNIPIPPSRQVIPWGGNWYQFSISFPRFLVIASYLYRRLFKEANADIEQMLSNYISNYYKIPSGSVQGIESIGYNRDGPNAIMMAVPYVGGHLLSKDLDLDDKINVYVRDYVSLNFVKSGEGLFPDYGYVFHSVLRAYGYIYSSIADFELMSKIYELGIEKLNNIYKIMEHPTIPLHFSPYFTRSYSCGSNRNGSLGFYTIQSTLVCSVKMPNWMLQFNGQRDNLCYYESDKSFDQIGQLWTFARIFLYADSDSAWQPSLIPYYPGVVTYDLTIHKFPSVPDALGNTTTTVFKPENSKTILVKSNNYIGMWQRFDMIHETWEMTVEELILVTELGFHRALKIIPKNLGENVLTISINLGEENKTPTQTIGLGSTVVQFMKNTSFIYHTNVKYKNLIHPLTNTVLKCAYIEPTIRLNANSETEGYVAYSNIHSNINQVNEVPNLNRIDVIGAVLEKDPKYPDYLFLHDKSKKVVCVGKYDGGYNQTIRIPVNMVTQKLKEPLVNSLSENAQSYIGITNSTYQMEFKSKGLK